MIESKIKRIARSKIIAITVLCLLLVNDTVWPYLSGDHNGSAEFSLARWSLIKALQDDNIEDPAKIILEATMGLRLIVHGKSVETVNMQLEKSAATVGTKSKIIFLQNPAEKINNDYVTARFYRRGNKKNIFEISLQNGVVEIKKGARVSGLKRQNVAIIGASGHVGTILMSKALSESKSVTALSAGSKNFDPLSMQDNGKTISIIAKLPDRVIEEDIVEHNNIIFNLSGILSGTCKRIAGEGRFDKLDLISMTLSNNALPAAIFVHYAGESAAKPRIINSSSIHVYDLMDRDGHDGPLKEDDLKLEPLLREWVGKTAEFLLKYAPNAYGIENSTENIRKYLQQNPPPEKYLKYEYALSKIVGEEIISRYENGISVRLAAIYGPGVKVNDKNVLIDHPIARWVNEALNNQPIIYAPGVPKNCVYIEDVVNVLWSIAEIEMTKDLPRVFNLGGTTLLETDDIVSGIITSANADKNLVLKDERAGISMPRPLLDMKRLEVAGIDINKFTQLKEGIKEEIRWQQNEKVALSSKNIYRSTSGRRAGADDRNKGSVLDDRIGYPLLGGYKPEDIRVMVIGTGGFIRTELVAMIDKLNREGRYSGKVVIVEVGPGYTAELIRQQGGKYYTVTKYPDNRPDEVCAVGGIAGSGSLTDKPTDLSLRKGETGVAAFMRYAGLDLDLIAIGVTEFGLQPNSQTMRDLAEFLHNYFKYHGDSSRLSIINTDNVQGNGGIIRNIVTDLAGRLWPEEQKFKGWLAGSVTFHDTMVDRIVDSPKSPLVPPYTEPAPKIRMAIEDINGTLPVPLWEIPGVVIRKEKGQIDMDHAWKLRVLNALHTSMVYVSALSGLKFVRDSANNPEIAEYLETLAFEDIAPIINRKLPLKGRDANQFARESILRFKNPNISHDVRWIGQDAIFKAGVRLAPTIKAADGNVTPEMAFAFASILRYVSPVSGGNETDPTGRIIYRGKNDPDTGQSEVYEFKERESFRCIPDELMNIFGKPRNEVSSKLRAILSRAELWGGVDLAQYQDFTDNLIDMYYRMTNGESSLQVLRTISRYGKRQKSFALKNSLGSEENILISEGKIKSQEIVKDLPDRAQAFKANLTKMLADHRDQQFFIGIETNVTSQIMPIYNAIEDIKELKDANDKPLFPQLTIERGSAKYLADKAKELNEEGRLSLNNTFIAARKVSVEDKTYDGIKGEGRAWIASIDDSREGDYLPIFEAITLNMMAYLNADLEAIENFYDKISDKSSYTLQEMIQNRIIRILPKATKLDTPELHKLYKLARQAYVSA